MNQNEELIERFYSSFARRDPAGMIACYHPQVVFSDPVFTELRGSQAGAMWQMLCASGRDLRIEFSSIEADDSQGQAHWEARYTFSSSGRMVHNIISAKFQFENGLIIRHVDHFDFWRWSGQALGISGLLLGWTPLVRKRVQANAATRLQAFTQRQAGVQP